MRFVSLVTFYLLFYVCVLAEEVGKIDYLEIGDKIPDFNLTTIDNQLFSTSNLKGQTTVLVFFATWCPPCVKELSHVQKEIWEVYQNNPIFKLFVVGREHTATELKVFQEQKGFTFPMLADTNREIFSLFAKQNVPRLYLISADGLILERTTGFNEDIFKKIVNRLNEELKNKVTNHF